MEPARNIAEEHPDFREKMLFIDQITSLENVRDLWQKKIDTGDTSPILSELRDVTGRLIYISKKRMEETPDDLKNARQGSDEYYQAISDRIQAILESPDSAKQHMKPTIEAVLHPKKHIGIAVESSTNNTLIPPLKEPDRDISREARRMTVEEAALSHDLDEVTPKRQESTERGTNEDTLNDEYISLHERLDELLDKYNNP